MTYAQATGWLSPSHPQIHPQPGVSSPWPRPAGSGQKLSVRGVGLRGSPTVSEPRQTSVTRGRGAASHALSVLPQHRHPGPRQPGRRRRRRDPPPAYLLGLRASGSRTVEQMQLIVRQALRRDRAVHPRQGRRRRPEGLQGPPGLRGRPGLPRPGRSRTRCAARAGPRCPPTRSAWPSSARSATLDEVAYLRFASVYRAFESADDFEAEIAMLRAERDRDDRSTLSRAGRLSRLRADPDRPARRGEAARRAHQRLVTRP